MSTTMWIQKALTIYSGGVIEIKCQLRKVMMFVEGLFSFKELLVPFVPILLLQ